MKDKFVKKLSQYFVLGDSEITKNVITLISGTSIAQVIPLLISPLLTRFFTPSDFGVYALYLGLATIFISIATARYEYAIMLPSRKIDALHILVLSIIISLVVSILLLFILTFFGERIRLFLKIPQLPFFYFYLLPISVLIAGIYQSLNSWFNRIKNFRTIAFFNISRNSGINACHLSFGFYAFKTGGLILGQIIGELFATIILIRRFSLSNLRIYNNISYRNIKQLASTYIDFPKYDLFSAIVNSISFQVPLILLSYYYSNEVVGYFSLSNRLLTIPIYLIAVSIGQVYFQRAQELTSSPKELSHFTEDIVKKMFFLGLVPFSIIAVFGDSIFALIFGESWRSAGTYAQLTIVWLAFVFFSSPLSSLFTIKRKLKLGLLLNTIILFFRVLIIVLTATYYNSPFTSILYLGVFSGIYFIVYTVFLLRMAKVSVMPIFWMMLKYATPIVLFLIILRWFLLW